MLKKLSRMFVVAAVLVITVILQGRQGQATTFKPGYFSEDLKFFDIKTQESKTINSPEFKGKYKLIVLGPETGCPDAYRTFNNLENLADYGVDTDKLSCIMVDTQAYYYPYHEYQTEADYLKHYKNSWLNDLKYVQPLMQEYNDFISFNCRKMVMSNGEFLTDYCGEKFDMGNYTTPMVLLLDTNNKIRYAAYSAVRFAYPRSAVEWLTKYLPEVVTGSKFIDAVDEINKSFVEGQPDSELALKACTSPTEITAANTEPGESTELVKNTVNKILNGDADSLTSSAESTDMKKLKAIYKWVCENIYYDSDYYNKKKDTVYTEADDILGSGLAV